MSTNEPLEPESVEYMDRQPAESGGYQTRPQGPQTVVFQSDGLPCCSGCGCLILCIGLLLYGHLGSVFTGAIVFLSAMVLAASALRLCGVHRYSPIYAYAVVPVFLGSLNLCSKLVKDQYAFSWKEMAGATILIYAFLWMAKGLGRR